jgi:hypothetical protein
MNEPMENPHRYKWPWFALAAVVLFLTLAVLWVGVAINKVEQQRDMNTPVPAGAK